MLKAKFLCVLLVVGYANKNYGLSHNTAHLASGILGTLSFGAILYNMLQDNSDKESSDTNEDINESTDSDTQGYWSRVHYAMGLALLCGGSITFMSRAFLDRFTPRTVLKVGMKNLNLVRRNSLVSTKITLENLHKKYATSNYWLIEAKKEVNSLIEQAKLVKDSIQNIDFELEGGCSFDMDCRETLDNARQTLDNLTDLCQSINNHADYARQVEAHQAYLVELEKIRLERLRVRTDFARLHAERNSPRSPYASPRGPYYLSRNNEHIPNPSPCGSPYSSPRQVRPVRPSTARAHLSEQDK